MQTKNGSNPSCIQGRSSGQTATLGQTTHKVLQEDGTNYIVIVNKQSGQATRAQIPSADSLLKSSKFTHSPQFVLTENKNKMSGENVTVRSSRCPAQLKPQSKTISRCVGSMGKNVKEDVKMNFSDLGFDDYDSTTSSSNVFSDEVDVSESSSAVKWTDEGYSESLDTIESFVIKKNLRTNDTSTYNLCRVADTGTPSCTIDMSGSSGYQSACGSSWFTSPASSDLTSPSPNSSQTTRKVILISPGPNTGNKLCNNSAAMMSGQVSSSCSINSPVTSLACNFQGAAFFQSPSCPSPAFSHSQHDLGKPLSSSTPVVTSTMSQSAVSGTSATASPVQYTYTRTSHNFMPGTGVAPMIHQSSATTRNHKSMNIVLPHLSQIPKSSTKMTITEHGIKQEPREPPTPQAGEVVIHINIKEKQTVVKMEKDRSRPSTPQPDLQDTSSTSDSLNNSLTNMHWLKGIQGINDPVHGSPTIEHTQPEVPRESVSSTASSLHWRCFSRSDIEKIAKECGRHKRPPFSYMTLIQMGLNSREDKRMTLREICRWIEDTFPYYKHTAKPGWKNSIRHNLSLYSIFEREKSKKHGSHWTIRDDCPEKSKSVPAKDGYRKGVMPGPLGIGSMLPLTLPTFLQQSHGPKIALPAGMGMSDRAKKGPQPILPRPMAHAPLQTYALIPIQNVGQSVQMSSSSQGQPMIIQLPQDKSGQGLAPQANQEPLLQSPLVPKCENRPSCTRLKKKQRYSNIAPKEAVSSPRPVNPINIVRQAWLDSQNNSTSDESDTSRQCNTNSGFTSPVQPGAKKPKLRTGLPTPKIYTRTTPPSRKGKARRKQKLVAKERELMAESSEEEDVENLKQDDPRPENPIPEDSPVVATSTPFKGCGFPSPQLPSPIVGFTPLRNSGLLDASFSEYLKDSDTESKGFLISPDIRCAKKLSLVQSRTPPNSVPLELNFSFSQTPLRCDSGAEFGGGDHNQSLSKFLSEFPIDTNMMEDGLPVDISALNWSVGDQSPLGCS